MKKILLLLALFFLANPCFAIKIGLLVDTEDVPLGTSVKGTIIDANTNHTIFDMEAMKGYELKPYNNVIAIKIDGKFYKINSDNIVIKTLDTGYVCTKSKWYRGILIVQNKGGKLTVINDVSIEDYIKGVVPAEMPAGWETEAHKAQAVAARSYAVANLGKRASLGFDLKDTPEDQAYGGASAETAKVIGGIEPRVALLSFSTKGSGNDAKFGNTVERVRKAAELAKETAPELTLDGEFQFDASLVPEVAAIKAPGSSVAGSANVFVFPDINAGNIGYKIAERLGGFVAVGPVCQGFAKPLNDLSRGCCTDDIVLTVAVTALQAGA